jgi:hypothetical protein
MMLVLIAARLIAPIARVGAASGAMIDGAIIAAETLISSYIVQ